MNNEDPFGFTFLRIIGSLLIVGVAGIALIHHLFG
jgi:hypothetical protein